MQKYAWGKQGSSSYAAKLFQCQGGRVEEGDTYAELWFGDHPSGTSSVLMNDRETELSQLFSDNPNFLGPDKERWDGHLPFLFKVRCCSVT